MTYDMPPIPTHQLQPDWRRLKMPLGLALLLVVLWTAWPLAIVPAGYRGVMTTMGKPSDIAHAVAYLASPEASYVTGQELHVNGGMYM